MFDMERFNLKMLVSWRLEKQYHMKMSNRFEALENVHDSVDKAWENLSV